MKIVLASGDDWQGIYVDGVLKMAGHSLKAADLLEYLITEKIVAGDFLEVDGEWLEARGILPTLLSEVKESKQ